MTLFFELWIAAITFCALLMITIWRQAIRINNAGIVDIAWAFGFSPPALLYVFLGNGYCPRKVLVSIMVLAWSMRLGFHLYRRVLGHHPQEDARYKALREKWGDSANQQLFVFFQLQGFLIAALSIPYLIPALNPSAPLSAWEFAGFFLWLIAFVGESLADHQLTRFKAGGPAKTEVCQVGLWRYSRHPNYFFEWLTWVAFWIYACGSPYGWIVFYAPALMFFFLWKVTGIPLTEELALKTKGENYRRYQKTTNAFFPGPVRNFHEL